MSPPKMCYKMEKHSPEYFETMRSIAVAAFDRDKVDGVYFSMETQNNYFQVSELLNREQLFSILDKVKNLMST